MSTRALARFLLCVTALLVAVPTMGQNRAEQRTKTLVVGEATAEKLRGKLNLPEFAALADKASESVNVTLEPSLLGMACRFLSTEDPEEAKAKKLCTSLRGIYVRHYTFDSDFAYPKADIEGLRRQLAAPGWSRIVGAVSKKENTNVDVFVLIDGEKAQGLSIIASQPREFTIVNVVGSIDLEQLHELKNLGVPDLEIESSKKPPPKPSARQ
jgi:hypothetical protein